MNETIDLPGTLSGLLRVAVHDVLLVEADPKFELNMSQWVEGSDIPGVVCEVCMAGAVLVQRTKQSLEDLLWMSNPSAVVDGPTSWKLEAINAMRTGCFRSAGSWITYGHGHNPLGWLDSLTAEQEEVVRSVEVLVDSDLIRDVDDSGNARFQVYLEAAALLESVGL